jgi:peptidoglycan hydrolase-like protein with peptidoglycan-binding domain
LPAQVLVRVVRSAVAVALASLLSLAAVAIAKAPGPSGGAGLGPVTSAKAPNSAKAISFGSRTLRLGMNGHDVRVLQNYLTIVGFPTPVAGHFGPITKQNVILFPTAQGLVPNGVVTRRVVHFLVLAKRKANQPPAGKVRINSDGTATAPAGAPQVVLNLIAAANKIIDKPYMYGGGHATWNDSGYDCSGSVSFALHGAGLLNVPEDSTELESYGAAGPGRWITIYADDSHTFLVVAGRAFDTANFGGPNIPAGTGPRWRSNPLGNLADGGNYVVRHPAGL